MQFPDRTADARYHREAARQYRAQGDYPMARLSYFKWVESLRQQNINMDGQLEHELAEARREYTDFVKTDPLYNQIKDAATAKIGEQPGILQTELYKLLSNFEKADIQYAMYFADDHGAVVRTKKGNTYSLSLPQSQKHINNCCS